MDTSTSKRAKREYTLGFKLSFVEQVEKVNLLTSKRKSTMEYRDEVLS